MTKPMQGASPEALYLASRRSPESELSQYARLEFPREKVEWVATHAEGVARPEPSWDDFPTSWYARVAERLRRSRQARKLARGEARVRLPAPSAAQTPGGGAPQVLALYAAPVTAGLSAGGSLSPSALAAFDPHGSQQLLGTPRALDSTAASL